MKFMYKRTPYIEGFKCVLKPMLDRHGGITVLDFDFLTVLIQSQKSL